MERKNIPVPLIVLSAILFILLVISVVGWTRARNELAAIKNGDAKLVGFKDSLAVCDNTSTFDAQEACVKHLSELSDLLGQYEAKIKNIQVPATEPRQ